MALGNRLVYNARDKGRKPRAVKTTVLPVAPAPFIQGGHCKAAPWSGGPWGGAWGEEKKEGAAQPGGPGNVHWSPAGQVVMTPLVTRLTGSSISPSSRLKAALHLDCEGVRLTPNPLLLFLPSSSLNVPPYSQCLPSRPRHEVPWSPCYRLGKGKHRMDPEHH